MADRWIANPEMPRPFPLKLESIRKAALERWGDAPISQDDILLWIYEGCPDARTVLLNAATRQSTIPGQGKMNPEAFMTTLFESGVFVAEEQPTAP
ncbi:MAG: hypothetical protein OXE86_11070 [Alphaproteobacteria bacterium]|nr:hypothetical protein [Alphaproteobacteria bacterium]